MKGTLTICLALALLLPSAIALNCNSLSGADLSICNSIQSTNLSSEDKDLLIADVLNKNKTSPNFDFIYLWNTNLNILSSPNGITSSSGTISNAWLKIITLMPSIIENNTLYASKNGKLMTSYNYQTSLPSGTESGDCRTDFYGLSSYTNLNIYLNDQFIGNSKLSAYIINNNPENLNFVSRLSIVSSYSVDHYKNERYCSKRKNGYCIKYSYRCSYSSTSHRTDTLKLEDSFNAKLYNNNQTSSFRITNKYTNITKGELIATNFTKLVLSFNNSVYQSSKYVYSLNYSLPYSVLTLKADKIENTNFNNIHIEKDNNTIKFNVKDASNCKIELYDHFSLITKNCDLTFNETNFSIRTDKTDYYDNETIKVFISPEDILVNLTYGNQTKLAKNYTEFKTELYENKISAKLESKQENVIVNVREKANSIILYNLSVVSFLGYFFYKSIKFYYLSLLI